MTCMFGMSFKDQNLREEREVGNGGEERQGEERLAYYAECVWQN